MTTIAILGTSGALGKPVLDAFQSSPFADKVSFPIKALTTKDKASSDKIQFVQGDLVADPEGVAAKLAGVDVIISLVQANPEILAGVEKVVKAVKPKIYITSDFGVDASRLEPGLIHPVVQAKTDHYNALKDTGIKVARIYTSFFRIPPIFFYAFFAHIGIDKENKTITKASGSDVVQFSTGPDIGRVVAAVSTTDPSKVKNEYRVISGETTVDKVAEELGGDFKVQTKSIDDLKSEFKAQLADGKPDFISFLFLTFALGKGKGAILDETDRELLNPGESVWKWDKW